MKIFKKVHCKAYMKKWHDGVYLSCTKDVVVDGVVIAEQEAKGTQWNDDEEIKVVALQNVYENGKWEVRELKDLSSFEDDNVEKTYRKRVEEEFDGFLVGFTYIKVSALIGTDFGMRVYNMNGDLERYYHLTKYPEFKKVAVVYFKNNAKRYVLPEDMEYVDE